MAVNTVTNLRFTTVEEAAARVATVLNQSAVGDEERNKAQSALGFLVEVTRVAAHAGKANDN